MATRMRGVDTRIAPGIYLDTITIRLREEINMPPEVTMTGRVRTGQRSVDQATTVTIKTTSLSELGREFIADIKATYGGSVAADAGDKSDGTSPKN